MIAFEHVWPAPAELIFGLLSGAFWIALIAGVIMVLSRRKQPVGRPSAVNILEERYARGEIDRDEFLERKAVLEDRSRR